jgi:putative ABC transport system permease protein
MFSVDFLQEILHTVKTNKLRTFLTGFSVGWGVLMLIILLGAGNGFQNGVKEKQFSRGTVNSMWLCPLWTSIPYKGFPEGRRIQFHNDDYEVLKKLPEVMEVTGRYDEEWWTFKSVMQYKNNYGAFYMGGSHPSQAIVDQITVDRGRFINQIDVDQFRKTAAIDNYVKAALFKDEDPIGKYFTVRGVPFEVVGIFHDASPENSRRIFIPISTRQRVFNGGDRIQLFGLMLADMTAAQIESFERRLWNYFADKCNFDPRDTRAMAINDIFKQYKQNLNLFRTINIVIWIVGIMTVIAGIMGVGNIMVITIKERTHEIGIRKALGATPGSIVGQVITETILITGVAGLCGLSIGVFLLDFAAKNIPVFDYFKNPEVDLRILLSAMVVIIMSGVLAGLAPALRAAGIRPIEALRDE